MSTIPVKKLPWLIEQLMEYSNNFMTNQIFLTMGAEKLQPPATAEKSRKVMEAFQAGHGLPRFHVEEGSGLSRRTKITAAQLTEVLKVFKPWRRLLPLAWQGSDQNRNLEGRQSPGRIPRAVGWRTPDLCHSPQRQPDQMGPPRPHPDRARPKPATVPQINLKIFIIDNILIYNNLLSGEFFFAFF